MTYSLLAYDRHTHELGAAAASCSIAVGGTVVYSRHGVGIVNTQHQAHLSIGQHVLDLMQMGFAPQEALERALADEPQSDRRQFLAANVRSATGAWTGAACGDEKRHWIGESCVAAGNLLADGVVVDRMVEAFHASRGHEMGERLLLALEAGEAAGGDWRGRQAAAVQVVPPPGVGSAINVDLRVDDHPDPLVELRRLYRMFSAEFDLRPRPDAHGPRPRHTSPPDPDGSQT